MSETEKPNENTEEPKIVIRDLKPKKDPTAGYADPFEGGSSSPESPGTPMPSDPYSY